MRAIADEGYSLVELMVAIVIFLLVVMAFSSFLTVFVFNQKSIEKYRKAQEVLESEVSFLKTLSLEDIDGNVLKDPRYGYAETVCDGFNRQRCGDGYEFALFKAYGNNTCLQLCCDTDYLSPYLKRLHAYVLWKDVDGKVRSLDVLFFVGEEL